MHADVTRYGAEIWVFTKTINNKLRVNQRVKVRKILGLPAKDCKPNT